MFSVIKKSELEQVIGGEKQYVDINIKSTWGDYVAKWTGLDKEHGKPKPTHD